MAEAKKAIKKAKEEPKTAPEDTEVKTKQKAVSDTAKAEKPAAEPENAPKTAKAGKRSAKAAAEAEEKAAKEERKKDDKPEESKPQQKPPRSKLERRGKNYRKSAELIEKDKEYKLEEALDLASKTASTKFDSTVELHIRLNVDPKQADQNIRDSVVLPAGSGKTVKIAVFADEPNAKKAKTAGADIAGEQEILSLLDKEQIDFDVLIAMPNMMVKLAKYARILGPKGLMPNPKSGTVTADVAKAVEQSKAGKIEYRVDSNGIVHVGIGKVSFGGDKLKQNADELLTSVKQNKPASIKGNYVRSLFITTTMGPSIAIEATSL
jgi:large subunit ribosomal protein L1